MPRPHCPPSAPRLHPVCTPSAPRLHPGTSPKPGIFRNLTGGDRMSWLSQLRSWLQRGRAASRNKRKTGRRCALTVEALERRELLSTLHLDLGTATSPAASGYVEV